MSGLIPSPAKRTDRRPRSALYAFDAAWLLALTIYAFAGMKLAPFHGDETEHLDSSRDFATYVLEGQPGRLAVAPPYPADSVAYIRVVTGTLTDYLFGLGWAVAGYQSADLPTTWAWWDTYEGNAARGALPSPPILTIGRGVSTLLFAASIAATFGLARRVGGRWLAWMSSGLYALNPTLLLNSRRALTEGALLCFGMLALWLGATIARRLSRGARVGWGLWAAFGVLSGLAVAAKMTGGAYVLAAAAWIAIAALMHSWRDRIASLAVGGAMSAAVCGLVFLALTPATWSDPAARSLDIVRLHQVMTEGVAADLPEGPSTLDARAARLVGLPFLMQPEYFEAPLWANFPAITGQIAAYDRSWSAGFRPGPIVGAALTLLALAGLVTLFLPFPVGALRRDIALGLLAWYGLMAAISLVNPLPWARYDMQVIPAAIVLCSVGLWQAAITARGLRRSPAR